MASPERSHIKKRFSFSVKSPGRTLDLFLLEFPEGRFPGVGKKGRTRTALLSGATNIVDSSLSGDGDRGFLARERCRPLFLGGEMLDFLVVGIFGLAPDPTLVGGAVLRMEVESRESPSSTASAGGGPGEGIRIFTVAGDGGGSVF